MEGLRSDSVACRYITDNLRDKCFTLIDVGCSGGIDPIWRLFGPRLTAYGFDPNLGECERLQRAETLPHVHYCPGFVGLRADDPIVERRAGRPYVQHNPWNRLAVARSAAIRQSLNPGRTEQQLTTENQWTRVELADPKKPIVLSEFLRSAALSDIDMIKIDVDGPDFEILQSLTESLKKLQVLAIGMEVNFVGSTDEMDHTFHNTDRFLRANGFDLYYLTVRPYARAALPARYSYSIPSQGRFGQPLQGDALYARDLGVPGDIAQLSLRAEKVAKLAFIFTAMGLFDCAAELLLKYRDRISVLLDIDKTLDMLCAEAQGGSERALSYRDYIEAFERDDPIFYP